MEIFSGKIRVTPASVSGPAGSGLMDLAEERGRFGRVRAHGAFPAGRRGLRPPAGPRPHPFLEGADGLIQVVTAVGGDGLAEFATLYHREVSARSHGGIRWAASPSSVTPGTWVQVWDTGRT